MNATEAFDTLNRLGVSSAQSGDFESAIEFFNQAIVCNPQSWMAYCNCGKANFELKQLPQAIECFQLALTIDADSFDAHFFLGLIYTDSKKFEKALAHLDQAQALQPVNSEVLYQQGLAHHGLEQYPKSQLYFEQVLDISPLDVAAHNALGNSFQKQGNASSALLSYDKALTINAHTAVVHFNRGISLQTLKMQQEAIASYKAAIQIEPTYVLAYFNCAVALEELGQIEESLSFFDKVIALNAESHQAYVHKASIYAERCDYQEAERLYNLAIQFKPDYYEAIWNVALIQLMRGNYESGWGNFEARYQTKHGASLGVSKNLARQWRGQDLQAHQTILLWCEQGHGDTLQFCRYVSMVADMGVKVIFEVRPELYALLDNIDPRVSVIQSGTTIGEVDWACSIMSLPFACGTTSVEKIPAKTPYLQSTSTKRQVWRDRLGVTKTVRVGLAWSGGHRPDLPEVWEINQRRNIPLAKFALLKHPQIEFISLQKGEAPEEELINLVRDGWDGPFIRSFSEILQDYSDTAALIESLDLVITVDTSMAHLAGAIGKPVWILNRFDACWRWLYEQSEEHHNRSDSPWYPTARLFRQAAPDNWEIVMQQVKNALNVWYSECSSDSKPPTTSPSTSPNNSPLTE